MCGITGKICINGGVVNEADIEAMNEAIKHRGPDDGGVFLSPKKNVGLGHRRLSIIDLSPLGHQPMSFLDRYWIVFNGEIYNFQEQREKMVSSGYVFRSKTDTEVIMALYDKYREGCLKYLRGMFSFAIYDAKEETLFCARDRVGKKPFKYYWDGKMFMFASELKAILTQPEYRKEPDYVAIHHYLTYQYCPAPFTGFTGIRKLEPAHYIFLDIKNGRLENKQYWELNYTKKLSLSEGDWIDRILNKLDESVKIRMISDVPLGAFLSGGIDSSAIVALMSRHSTVPIKTFSIGFSDIKYNELPYAKMVAEQFKTDHREFIVEPHAMELLPMLVNHYKEPYADSSALPTYYVSKLSREHVTVALNGDGGDENFAGYSRYSALKFSNMYRKFKSIHNLIIKPTLDISKHYLKRNSLYRGQIFSDTLSESAGRRYVNYICYFTDAFKKQIYSDLFSAKFKNIDSSSLVADQFSRAGSDDVGEQAMFADFVTYLPEDLLAKVDIASMAVSLEGRSPFLDHEFLEMTAQIPFKLKLHGFNHKKFILKKALKNILPHDVMYRKKMGFGIPIHSWFRNELKDYSYDMLLSEVAMNRGIFKKEEIAKLLDEHNTTRIDHGHRIWSLITLEHWFREFFD